MKFIHLSIAFISISLVLHAQDKNVTIGDYELKIKETVAVGTVKDQGTTGTCWSFATTSFIEAEIMRITRQNVDIAEMYFVRNADEEKADNYVRMHGKGNFSPGGQAHDVMHVIEKSGMVPESVYPGRAYGYNEHNHHELNNVLTYFTDGVVKSSPNRLTTVWPIALNGILDAYLGKEISNFTFKDKTYSPETFADEMKIHPADYVELTTYNHMPFYAPFVLKVPDNWSFNEYYNLPLDVFMETINHALDNGFSICWDGDVSDKWFSHKDGLAISPTEEAAKGTPLQSPAEEKNITQTDRQSAYNSHAVTDDHLMHITGYARGKDGTIYYQVKNSWGTTSNSLEGYLYMSEPYFRLGTIAVMVHKNAIPDATREKLGL